MSCSRIIFSQYQVRPHIPAAVSQHLNHEQKRRFRGARKVLTVNQFCCLKSADWLVIVHPAAGICTSVKSVGANKGGRSCGAHAGVLADHPHVMPLSPHFGCLLSRFILLLRHLLNVGFSRIASLWHINKYQPLWPSLVYLPPCRPWRLPYRQRQTRTRNARPKPLRSGSQRRRCMIRGAAATAAPRFQSRPTKVPAAMLSRTVGPRRLQLLHV